MMMKSSASYCNIISVNQKLIYQDGGALTIACLLPHRVNTMVNVMVNPSHIPMICYLITQYYTI